MKNEATWEIFEALADRHVVGFTVDDDSAHQAAFIGACSTCIPVLAALRELGWECDGKLAAKLDNINVLAADLEMAL